MAGLLRYKCWAGVWASIILGLFFIVAGLGKLLSNAESFNTIFNPLPAFLAPGFTWVIFVWLPYIELVVGLLLICGIAAKLMAILSSVLIAGFITNNTWMVSRGLGYEPCGCLGIMERILHIELSSVGSLYLDIAMLALVLIILSCYQSNFLNLYPWFLGRSRVE